MATTRFVVEPIKGHFGTNYMVRIVGTRRYAAKNGAAYISSSKAAAQRWADTCNAK